MIYYILNIKRKKIFIQGLILDYYQAENKYRQKQLRFILNFCVKLLVIILRLLEDGG